MYRIALAALVAGTLAACDIITPPEAPVDVHFFDEYIPTDTGCNLRLRALGSGGTSEWGRVQVFQAQTVIQEYSGEQFWGRPRIMAGEQQISLAVPLQSGRTDYLLEAIFNTPTEQVMLRFSPVCRV